MSIIPRKICSLIKCTEPAVERGMCVNHSERVFHTGRATNASYSQHHMDEYRIWSSMKSRCLNTNHHAYSKYGGRGIKMCDRWLDKYDGFQNFILDMDWKPFNNASVDRIDNYQGYTPENCRWATKVEQAANKRKAPRSKSGYLGVFIDNAAPDKWFVAFEHKGNTYRLGRFKNVEEAALEYDKGVIFFRGYGTTNFL